MVEQLVSYHYDYLLRDQHSPYGFMIGGYDDIFPLFYGIGFGAENVLAHPTQMRSGEVLRPQLDGQHKLVVSPSGRFRLVFQTDGNLVFYGPGDPTPYKPGMPGSMFGPPIFSSQTNQSGISRLVMQTDGNLVIYGNDGKPKWASDTHHHPGALLLVSDGDAQIILPNGTMLWSAKRDGLHTYRKKDGFDIGDVGEFVSNAVQVAGKEIGKAADDFSRATKDLGKLIESIPIVGAPLNTIFSAAWDAVTAPAQLTVSIVSGERIDRAILNHLEKQVNDIKAVGPYAQMVISFVPGVGTAVSAAIGAGLALMNGQPIDKALIAGVTGLIPGGPIAKAALTMAYHGVEAAIEHTKLDLAYLGKTAMGVVSSALNLPPIANQALLAGVTMTGQLANGIKIENAISTGVIDALPIPSEAKSAMHQANELTLALVHGQRVDQAVLQRVGSVTQYLPVSADFKASIATGIATGKGIIEHKDIGQILAAGLQTGMADKLISGAIAPLSADVKKALQSGLALGTGVVKQAQRAIEIPGILGKLTESGIQLSKTVPAVAQARRLVGAGTNGFDVAHGLLQMQAKAFDVISIRNKMTTPADKKGFDMAMAQKIGQVASIPKPSLSPAAQAGHAITVGIQGHHEANKVAIMQSVTTNASATVGATLAVKEIAATREGWLIRLLKALGLRK